MSEAMATNLNDLPGGPPIYSPEAERIPSAENQQMTHSVMSELQAKRQAEQFQNTAPPPPGQMINDPRGNPYDNFQGTPQGNFQEGLFERWFSRGIAMQLKEPLLVAVICFLIHQEFFSNIILGFLPYSLRYMASPGSSSMIPSVIKALIVGIVFFFARTLI